MFIFLGHEDVPVDVSYRRLKGETRVMQRIHNPRYRKAGVKFVVMATGGDPVRPFGTAGFRTQTLGAFKYMDDMFAEVDEAPDELMIIRSASDFQEALNGDKIGIILHFEGGTPLDGQLFMLRSFYRVGLRSLQPAWYFRNELADTASEPNPGGLSRFGRMVVEEMNRLGMVIDVSHLSEASAMDVAKVSRDPIMASHSNAKAVRDHYRNLSDDLIRAIAEKGGLIGVVLCPPFVSAVPATMDHLLDHIDYLKRLVGIKHIALGPDYIDYAQELITGEVSAKTGKTAPGTGFPVGLETVCELPRLGEGLVGRGYTNEEIAMIMGGNLLRLYQQVLK
jgi:membrane dipeptidase